MKKLYILFLSAVMALSFCACSFSGKENEGTADLQSSESTSTTADAQTTEDNALTDNKTTEKSTAVKTTNPPETTENSGKQTPVTYYSENPNNKYISAVVSKYGADASTLVALIKTNSSTPGATVLQFSGEKDSNGNLVKTKDTLKYVYDVRDNGTVKKASGKKSDNDGYSYIESYVNYNLAVKYIIPQLDDMKKERTYEDYFAN